MEYTLSLAIFNYLPVFATLAGQIIIFRIIKNRTGILNWGFTIVAVVMIFIAGIAKANWKLIMVVNMQDIVILKKLLFMGLAPGFTIFAFAIWNVKRISDNKNESKKWFIPILIILLFGAISIYMFSIDKKWSLPLITLVTISNFIFFFICFKIGRSINLKLWPWLFILSYILSLAMAGISVQEQTLTLQWIEEIVNATGTCLFALASWKLYMAMKSI